MTYSNDRWHQKWQDNDIGFHLDKPNPYLVVYFHHLHLSPGASVLVPLCGKSLDMIWLQQHGFHVVGIELSDTAANAFFMENNIGFEKNQLGDFIHYATDNLDIYVGDLFQIDAAQLPKCEGYYDRAALIALAPSLRQQYIAQVSSLLAAQAKGLVITIDYQTEQPIGPPFNISENDFRTLYKTFSIEQLQHETNCNSPRHLAESGLKTVDEYVYRVSKR